MQLKRNFLISFPLFIAIVIAGCSPHSKNRAQGYIEGRYTYMTTSVSGVLNKLLVERGTKVKKGDVLV